MERVTGIEPAYVGWKPTEPPDIPHPLIEIGGR